MNDHSTASRPLMDGLKFAQAQVRRLIDKYPGLYPLYTDGGRWKHDRPAWTHWCDGFLPGMMWLFLESGQADEPDYWRDKAQTYSAALEPRKEDRDVHDLGFIFYHGTYRRWFEATVRDGRARAELKDVVVRAAEVLAMRFRERGEYLCSFVGDDSLFIDIMMNVPIIFYAARELGDEKLQQIAMRHCLTTRRTLVRADGSTSHEALFDTTTGQFMRQSTHQGYSADSCWSRGLAWSLYGFTSCYQLTGDERFLETAELNARYFLDHTPSDGVPPWDYDHPGTLEIAQPAGAAATESAVGAAVASASADRLPAAPSAAPASADHLPIAPSAEAASARRLRFLPDSSAAAIAASGLLDLASVVPDAARAATYRSAALNVLATLSRPPYLATDDPAWEGILKRGVYHIHKNLGVDESVMWGEFFFVEAMVKSIRLTSPAMPSEPRSGGIE